MSEFEKLTSFSRNGLDTKGAEYMFTTIVPKIDYRNEEKFIECLREGRNDKVVRMLRQLSQGELSEFQVFEGYLELPERKIAVKKIKTNDTARSKEIEILRRLDHENLVKYYINETKQEYSYIVMDMADSTLEKWLMEENRRDSEVLCKICKDFTTGLSYLHQNKIIHRDMKPCNVLIFDSICGVPKAKLTDFGISRIMERRPDGVTTSSGVVGTLTFIPPEAFTNLSTKFDLKPNFDIFSLGIVIAFTMTRGKHVFKWEEDDLPIQIQGNISKVKVNWELLNGSEFLCLKNLLQVTFKKNPSERSNLTVLMQHPFFWDHRKQFRFIQAVSNDIKNNKIDQTQLQNNWEAYKDAYTDIEDDWKLRFDLPVQNWIAKKDQDMDLKKKKTRFEWRKYDGKSIVHLLNFMRDQHQHYISREAFPDLSDDVVGLFGKDIAKYEAYCVSIFPEICAIVYNVLQDPVIKGSHCMEYFKDNKQKVFTLNWN